MKDTVPRISIITCSYNQGQFIERTILSVLNQNYPDFEHIIIDGLSTDETVDVIAAYPHLIVVRERDQGQADAINKGFNLATGDILCFLNSDDTLAPSALHRVAKEIDPMKGRYIVMGRCQFIDEKDETEGIEHPSFYVDHKTVLKIWQGHGLPQPAIFWSREVLKQCGALDIHEKMVLDYDLFCRFSARYDFHYIDQVLANYRLHPHSITNSIDDATRLKESIRISKRYWGRKGPLFYLQLWISLQNNRRQWQARHYLKKANNLFKNKSYFSSSGFGLISLLMGPDIIYYALFNPYIKKQLKLFAPSEYLKKRYPHCKVYLNYSKLWPDRWVGPKWCLPLPADRPIQNLLLWGLAPFQKKLTLHIEVNGIIIATYSITSQNNFSLQVKLPETLTKSTHELAIRASEWFIMHHYIRNQDYRPIAWKLLGFTLT